MSKPVAAGPASVGAPAGFSNTFRALRHPNFRLFFFGQLVSVIGTWMQTIAQQWLVYRLTGSATMLGVISLLGLIPLLPCTLWGGSLADRFPKRTVLIAAQTALMIPAAILAVLTWTGAVQVWHVLLLAMVLAGASAVEIPVRQSFVVEMVEGKEDLTNAIALNSTIFSGGRALGPAFAGIAVATVGEAGAFGLNALSFLAIIGALLLMRMPAQPARQVRVGLGAHVLEAAHYVRTKQSLMVLISMVGVSAFLSMPYSVLLPVFAQKILRESAQGFLHWACTGPAAFLDCRSPDALTYGLLMSAVGVGAVMGALLVASLPAKARRGRWLTTGNLLFPAAILAMSQSRSFLLSLALLVVVGLAFVFQNSLANTLLQMASPDHLRGRVMSFYTLVFQSMMRLGSMQAGLMGDFVGAPLAVGIGALICLGYGGFVAWRFPKVRQLG